jgi:putative endonuclease
LFGWLQNRKKLLADRKLLGKWGEKRAERFLNSKGLKTLTRNFSCKTGEIDLIMVDHDASVVFTEVKTRAADPFQSPEAAVTPAKKARLLKAARYFLATHKIENRPFRFDLVAITLPQKGPPNIEYFQNAFTP